MTSQKCCCLHLKLSNCASYNKGTVWVKGILARIWTSRNLLIVKLQYLIMYLPYPLFALYYYLSCEYVFVTIPGKTPVHSLSLYVYFTWLWWSYLGAEKFNLIYLWRLKSYRVTVGCYNCIGWNNKTIQW